MFLFYFLKNDKGSVTVILWNETIFVVFQYTGCPVRCTTHRLFLSVNTRLVVKQTGNSGIEGAEGSSQSLFTNVLKGKRNVFLTMQYLHFNLLLANSPFIWCINITLNTKNKIHLIYIYVICVMISFAINSISVKMSTMNYRQNELLRPSFVTSANIKLPSCFVPLNAFSVINSLQNIASSISSFVFSQWPMHRNNITIVQFHGAAFVLDLFTSFSPVITFAVSKAKNRISRKVAIDFTNKMQSVHLCVNCLFN